MVGKGQPLIFTFSVLVTLGVNIIKNCYLWERETAERLKKNDCSQ